MISGQIARKELPVIVDRFGPVAADEGIDDVNSQLRRRIDHLVKMIDDRFAVFGIGIEWIGIITEPGDFHAMTSDESFDAFGHGAAELRHVHMGYARITPIGMPGGHT